MAMLNNQMVMVMTHHSYHETQKAQKSARRHDVSPGEAEPDLAAGAAVARFLARRSTVLNASFWGFMTYY